MTRKARLKQKRNDEDVTDNKDHSPIVSQRSKLQRKLNIIHRNDLTDKQKEFLKLALDNDTKIMFVEGPAGTSKSYLSILTALELLNLKKVSDITYLRSAVESSSHSVGFLPGDLNMKIGVYLKVLADKLEELLPKEDIDYLMKDNRISGESINFLRGQNWNAKVVIVDEAQNLNLKELITVITRIGAFSKIILLGDAHQSDIRDSGFLKMIAGFDDEESRTNGIRCFRFYESDCVRSGICKFILQKLKNIS
jgi:phosphate starvation-inducible PhoH-like protein